MILFDLSWFSLILAGSHWSELVLIDLSWFFLIWAGSSWSEQVLFDLSWFFLILAGDALTIIRSVFWVSIYGNSSIWKNRGHWDFRGGLIQIRRQNWGGTIFGSSGPDFCTKFGHNTRTMGRTDSVTYPSCFSSNFTEGEGSLSKILETCKLSETLTHHCGICSNFLQNDFIKNFTKVSLYPRKHTESLWNFLEIF